MAVTIHGSSGISSADGSAASPGLRGGDQNTGVSFGSDEITLSTNGIARAFVNNEGLRSPGHILQVKQAFKNDAFSYDQATFTAIPGLSVDIRATAANSKMFLMANVYLSSLSSAGQATKINFVRGNTAIAQPTGSPTQPASIHQWIYEAANYHPVSMTFLDSTTFSTTEDTTYSLKISLDNYVQNKVYYVNRYTGDANYAGISTLTVMEVAGTL